MTKSHPVPRRQAAVLENAAKAEQNTAGHCHDFLLCENPYSVVQQLQKGHSMCVGSVLGYLQRHCFPLDAADEFSAVRLW